MIGSNDRGGTVVVLTARELEFDAVRRHLTGVISRRDPQGTIFAVGQLPGGRWSIALAAMCAGHPDGATLTERAMAFLRPDAVIFVGVATSLRDDIACGDIVVATRISRHNGGTANSARPPELEQLARSVQQGGSWQARLPEPSRRNPPAVHVAPIVAGIELGRAGAAQTAHRGSVPSITVCGISEVADGPRPPADNLDGRLVAAGHAAAFALALVDRLDRAADGGHRQPAEPPINFEVHRVRANSSGAPEDFEQMLALLVQAEYGSATRVFANPGDWGIDVLVGDFDDPAGVTIWQAKYFLPGVTAGQRRAIGDSYAAAQARARKEGHAIARWILCIPSSMDGPTTRWWQRWKAEREAESTVQIELWDETELRSRLARPAAAHVRAIYYQPYREHREPPAAVTQLRVIARDGVPGRWAGGEELCIGTGCYLLHDPVEEQVAADRSWWWREATAEQIEPEQQRVRLRQVEVGRSGPSGMERRAALTAQAELLSALDGRGGLPRRLAFYDEGSRLTLVVAQPAGPSWLQSYQLGGGALDRLGAASVLAAMAPVCGALAELHRRGHAHRAAGPEAVVLVGPGRRGALRDLGLIGMAPVPGEGPPTYRAPEQQYAVQHRSPGPPTDVYQVAAVVYHTISGHPPGRAPNPPVAATLPGFPAALDEALVRALDPDPGRRPSMGALAAALRTGRAELSRGGRS